MPPAQLQLIGIDSGALIQRQAQIFRRRLNPNYLHRGRFLLTIRFGAQKVTTTHLPIFIDIKTRQIRKYTFLMH
jgi:3-deoxy-D-arabino-heptulosonate 7-phosphate (DAHP) synthase class II